MAAKRVLGVLAACALLLYAAPACGQVEASGGPVESEEAAEAVFTDSGIEYTETAEEIHNPDRGFYQALGHNFDAARSNAVWSVDQLKRYLEGYGLLHFRFGLSAFSDNGPVKMETVTENGVAVQRVAVHGADAPLPEAMLACLEATLHNLRLAGGTAVVRFSYNLSGHQETVRVENGKPVNKYVNAEPAAGMTLVETHIAQVGEVLSRYADVVTSVETGMFGPWGEQHSTPLADSNNSENYYRLVQAWLNALPAGRTVSVRRPLYFIHWANRRFSLDLTEQTLGARAAELAALGGDALRVGVFNDGYLGSSSDLGTFSAANRASVVQFLNSQAERTLYGGEVVADAKTGGIGEYNRLEHICSEAFLTHTSYLNKAWNYEKVIREWENTPYTGEDPVYAGTTGYRYVSNHLGYRLVLRNSELTADAAQGGLLRLRGSVENVGFGNVINEKKAEVLLVGPTATYRAEVSLDARAFRSQTTASYALTLRLPSAMPAGAYSVYVKFSDAAETLADSPFRTIRFANADETVWNAELGANRLGNVTVTDSANPGTYPDFVEEEGAETPQRATLGAWGKEANAPYTFSGTDPQVVSWSQDTAKTSAYVQVEGYTDAMTALSIRFTASAEVRLAVYAEWSSIVGHKAYPVGENTVTLPDITETQGYQNAMRGKTSFRLRFFLDYDTQVAAPKSVTFTEISLSAPGASDEPEQPDTPETPETFTVEFDLAGGTLVSGECTQRVERGQSAVPPECAYEGRAFVGWDSDAYTSVTEDARVTAVWRVLTYTVRFDGNGGTLVSGEAVQQVSHGGNAAPPVFAREGYAFSGWDGSADGVTTDVTLTAQWTKVSENGTAPTPSAPAEEAGRAGCGNGCGMAAAMLTALGVVFFVTRRL